MKIFIDTSNSPSIALSLMDKGNKTAHLEFEAKHAQAEKLLPAVDCMLKNNGLSLNDISEVCVKNSGDSFTSLRIGIVTANTLAYALDLPVTNEKGQNIKVENIFLVKPQYSEEPRTTQPKKR
jgi:tRNA threonylcarbamoyladenosine biosynthesis protein TsaB